MSKGTEHRTHHPQHLVRIVPSMSTSSGWRKSIASMVVKRNGCHSDFFYIVQTDVVDVVLRRRSARKLSV